MMARLGWVHLQPSVIVDVGGGMGCYKADLAQTYPDAQFFATAFSSSGERLPFQTNTVDLLLVNLKLPWCVELAPVFAEWRRVLSPNGLVIFSSLGPDTLCELGKSSLNLLDMHDVGDALLKAGFVDPVLDRECLTFTYRKKETIFDDLRAMSILENDLPLSASEIEIEPNAAGVMPVTFEVIYGYARGALVSSMAADKDGVVKISLEAFKKQLFNV